MKNNQQELIALISAAREERLSSDELEKLDKLLLDDPEARQTWLRYMQMHSLLETFPPDANEQAIKEAVGATGYTRFKLPPATWVFAAATVLVAILFAIPMLDIEDKQSPEIATLIFAEECNWTQPPSGYSEGQRLPSGPVQLSGGTAVIRFDGGAEMVLSGDAMVGIISPESGSLDHGEVVIRAEEGAEGFRLRTPSGDLVDLGTEFTVRVDPTGETEVHVHEGEVATSDSVVSAGSAVRLGSRKQPLKLGAPRFSEVVKKAKPRERRDLMAAYEGFFLDAGTYHPSGIVHGKGWAGPWRLRTKAELGRHNPDTSNNMIIGYGEMNIAWPVRGGRKGMLKLPPGTNIKVRQLSSAIDLSQDGITYMSFLAAEVVPADFTATGKHRNDFRITLRSSEDYYGETLSVGWSKNRVPRVRTNSGAAFLSVRRIPQGETVFCIAKIIRSENDSDEIYFRFYRTTDKLDFAEPANWDVVTRDYDLSSKLDLLLITAEGSSTRYVDEVRIGPSWRSVTPFDEENQ